MRTGRNMAILSTFTLANYVRMVNEFPRLSRQEESELCHKWRSAFDVRAREKLIRSNLRYVVSLALKYRHYELSLSELIAEGNFGLVHALSKFDPERGNRFVTYAAYWIRAYILDYIIHCRSLVGVGSGPLRTKLFFRLRRESARIHSLVGDGDCADMLLAKRFGVSRDKMAALMHRLESRDLSLDLAAFDGAPTSIVDTIPAPNCSQEQAYQDCQDARRKDYIVRTAFKVLDSREKTIIECHLMRDSEDQLSLADVGRLLGISRERARQLETRAKRKLRRRILELSGQWGMSSIGVHSAA
jgi:RNA polymerase sigma-32 factor